MKKSSPAVRSRAGGAAKASAAPAPAVRNLGELESSLSLLLGGWVVLTALFPRSLRQAAMLALGAGLVFRGVTRRSEVYAALGLDAARGSIFSQLARKYPAAARD